MAQLTKEAQNILARIYSGDNISNTKSSNILQNPGFVEKKENLSYKSDIESNLGITGFDILDIIDYNDYKIVFGNYDNNTNGAVGIFSVNDDSLLYAFNKTEELTTIETLKPFKFISISKTGAIVGLQNYGITTHFFRFTDFLTDLQDFIDGVDTVFFDANFDISTEIKKEEDGTTDRDIKLGNVLFNSYEKIGFNQDTNDSEIFSFVLWSSSNDIMEFIRFSIDAIEINTIKDISFSFNEPVNLTQGDDLPGSDFDSVTVVGISTGETFNNNETTYGSILFSTQKDAGSGIKIPFGPVKINDVQESFVSGGFRGEIMTFYPKLFNEFIFVDNSKMQQVLQPVRDYLSNNNSIINAKVQITVETIPLAIGDFYKGSINDITISTGILSATSVEIINRLSWSTFDWSQSNIPKFKEETILKYDGTEIILNTFEEYTTPDEDLGNRIDYALGVNDFNTNGGGPRGTVGTAANVAIKITNNVIGEVLQATTEANTTSQIIIKKDSNKNSLYEIFQSENDSYQGTDPVFLSPLKAYIPLKKRDTNKYEIFEFNGNTSQNTIEIQRFLNTVPEKDGDLIIQLLKPVSINNVFEDEIPLPTSRYTLSGNTLTVKSTVKDKQIRVAYQSNVGSPKTIHIKTSTTSSDLFISGVSTVNEVESNTPSIIGAGDTHDEVAGLDKQVFGMNLYRSNSPDFDAIAEDTQPIDFKIEHVRGYRQKDLLWVEAYNADFSSYVKWVQIYPENVKPYTYIPYRNTLLELELERLNSNIDQQLNLSAFDRALLNISTSNNITIATTTAEITDLNGSNNNITLFGSTNQPIIEEKRTITKTRNISTEINVNIETAFIDRSGDTEIKRVEPSNEMAKLFNPHELENRDENHIDNFKLYDSDGNLIKEGDTLPYLFRVDSSVWFKADFVKVGDKTLGKLEIYNALGQLLSSEELPADCDGLLSYEKEFRFTDEVNETQYFTWDVTPWDTKPWQPDAKGGK